LLKRGLKGTYVSVEPFHLFRYLDEQSFRFNNRKMTGRYTLPPRRCWYHRQAIDLHGLDRERGACDVKHAKGGGSGRRGRGDPAPPAPSSSPPKDPEFEHFEDFARRILSVPKAEIEEQERLYQSQRRPRKRKELVR
jgi:hypothetical protein